MELFRHSLAEAIEQIEWEAWKLTPGFPRKELDDWMEGRVKTHFSPASLSPILVERSIQTFKQHK